MNNKGQALILFVILLPVFVFALILIFDFTYVSINKQKLENIAEDSLKYIILDNKEIDEVRQVILLNNEEIEIIDITPSSVHLKYEIKSIFGVYEKYDRYKIEVNISGYVENNKLKIIEMG